MAADSEVAMWEVEGKQKDPSKVFKAHRRTIVSLKLSSDGKEMLTGR